MRWVLPDWSFHPLLGSGNLRFIIFLLEVPIDVAGVAAVVVATTPDGGAKADAAVADCAYKAPFSATQKLA